ncbi:MAG: tRNA (guanosine(46)-N7)-methyltransferase TrmB, partial [Gammaproteobacteria bacterium]|nr:tRNA (guanosine(46)-N7)-methyltransferase TrmB [Gammaproteobacteria bacterium]
MLSSRPAVSHRIRSFVMRAGRMTAAQERGWKEGFSRFGLDVHSGLLDWEGIFSESGRRIVEIGFGMGDSLLEMALADPEAQFL